MHDPNAEGNAYFKCDYCRSPWSEDRPMVEGHKGSLICAPCLTVGYAQVVVHQNGVPPGDHGACTLCLMHKDAEPHWSSPIDESVLACHECLVRAAVTLDKDPDFDWAIPAKA